MNEFRKGVDWKPYPKQELALLSTCFETLYGGARGGGKTDTGIAWMLYDIEHPRYRGLVIRKHFSDLSDWIARAMFKYGALGAKHVGDEIRFPSGAVIKLGHLKDASSYRKYQGQEFQRMLIEELTHIPTELLYLQLISSCRSTVEGLRAMVFATTNPGEVGHFWVKRRFVDPSVPMQPFEDKVSGRRRVYIPATVDDNPALLEKDPGYIKFLDSLPEDQRLKWRMGSWEQSKIKGAYFAEEMDRAVAENRIGELPWIEHEDVYTSWDLGLNDTQVCWFYQLIGESIRFIDLEYASDKSWGYHIATLQEKPYKYGTHFLPHDGTKRCPESLLSFRDKVENAGFKAQIVPRTKDKLRDIEKTRSLLSRVSFDHVKCTKGVEALHSYRREYDEARGIYKDTPYHDWTSHYADAFMAGLMTLPTPLDRQNSLERQQAAHMDYIAKLDRRR